MSIIQRLRRAGRVLDTYTDYDLYHKGRVVYAKLQNVSNVIRRMIQPRMLKWKHSLKSPAEPLLLHLGCGDRHLQGYINVDWRKTRATDLTGDIRRLPYGDNSVSIIECYHVFEHIPRHDIEPMVREWQRVLVPGGKLVIELPDFDENVRLYLEGDEFQLHYIFGRQRFPGDAHYFGYNFARLQRVLTEAGFANCERLEAQDYHRDEAPCMRVEATTIK